MWPVLKTLTKIVSECACHTVPRPRCRYFCIFQVTLIPWLIGMPPALVSAQLELLRHCFAISLGGKYDPPLRYVTYGVLIGSTRLIS
jgi:hypothetical protein